MYNDDNNNDNRWCHSSRLGDGSPAIERFAHSQWPIGLRKADEEEELAHATREDPVIYRHGTSLAATPFEVYLHRCTSNAGRTTINNLPTFNKHYRYCGIAILRFVSSMSQRCLSYSSVACLPSHPHILLRHSALHVSESAAAQPS